MHPLSQRIVTKRYKTLGTRMVKLEKGKILSSLIAIALLFGMNAKANATSKIEFSYANHKKIMIIHQRLRLTNQLYQKK